MSKREAGDQDCPYTLTQMASGHWGFVGRIPISLGLRRADGTSPTAYDEDVTRHCGPGFAKLVPRSWATKEAALAAARDESRD